MENATPRDIEIALKQLKASRERQRRCYEKNKEERKEKRREYYWKNKKEKTDSAKTEDEGVGV
jgi:broad specificity polyphosphatase/5'/3'-nucleotidase SurE